MPLSIDILVCDHFIMGYALITVIFPLSGSTRWHLVTFGVPPHIKNQPRGKMGVCVGLHDPEEGDWTVCGGAGGVLGATACIIQASNLPLA